MDKGDIANIDKMVDEIAGFMNPRINRNWGDFFGSIVMVYLPRENGRVGNVTGWVHPSVDDPNRQQVMIESIMLLVVTVLKQGVSLMALLAAISHAVANMEDERIVSLDDPDLETLN